MQPLNYDVPIGTKTFQLVILQAIIHNIKLKLLRTWWYMLRFDLTYISTLHNLEDGKNQNNILIDYKWNTDTLETFCTHTGSLRLLNNKS